MLLSWGKKKPLDVSRVFDFSYFENNSRPIFIIIFSHWNRAKKFAEFEWKKKKFDVKAFNATKFNEKSSVGSTRVKKLY